ncbi:hypothetical protein E3C22_16690 [Jiella endophytica]|uniref:Phage tail protein n=1 Tax=Jiella endophytica TaxID=2558362 RepID=A0A4Y8RE27_9HYPH|nr:hypothetical protein [Jiella endophytica]TFF20545.1 hypothetical protein E3C22_16690 [Jiella endophytica]
MKAWPATLPQNFDRPDYLDTIGDNRLLTEQESGAVKGRPRFSYIPDPFQGSMRMTSAQYEILRTFWKDVGGVLPFSMPEPGKTGATWIVQFGRKPFSRTNLGGDRWRVQLDMVRLPQ